MLLKRLLLLGALGGLLLPLTAAPVPVDKVSDEAVKDRGAFVPNRKFQVLPGKAVGVLASEVVAVMGEDGRGGPPDAMAFSRDAQSFRWIYVVDNDKPIITNLQVEVGEKANAERVVYPKLSMANAKQVSRWDVKSKYSLVEVEVNDGKGSPATEGFVATKMSVLDGSKAYPIKVEEAIAEAKKQYAAYLKEEAKRLDEALEKAQKAALGEEKPNGKTATTELMVITWMSEKDRLRVAFASRMKNGKTETVKVQGGGRGPFPLPVPPLPVKEKQDAPEDQAAAQPAPGKAQPAPPQFELEVTTGTEYWIDFGRAYEFSKEGKLVNTLTLAPVNGKNVLQPPPVRGGGPVPLPPGKPGVIKD